jgi:hypothetical protein
LKPSRNHCDLDFLTFSVFSIFSVLAPFDDLAPEAFSNTAPPIDPWFFGDRVMAAALQTYRLFSTSFLTISLSLQTLSHFPNVLLSFESTRSQFFPDKSCPCRFTSNAEALDPAEIEAPIRIRLVMMAIEWDLKFVILITHLQ